MFGDVKFIRDRYGRKIGQNNLHLREYNARKTAQMQIRVGCHRRVCRRRRDMNPDRFETLKEITDVLKRLNIQPCGLILVIVIMGETIASLDDDGIIPAYGFGDAITKDDSIFPLKKNGECKGFMEVLKVYNEVTPTVQLGGPTNFAPLIDEAVRIVKEKKQYHILVIVTDGQVTNEEDTVRSILEASEYPLSIVVIGVGDGPWDVMKDFDDKLPERWFDNFQFVDFHKVKSEAPRNFQTALALATLMEIPDQFRYIRDNGLLKRLAIT